MSANKYLIILGGPTASGKTTFAINLAKHFDTEIISCDSRQFYKEMHIGTAKPTPEELSQVKHHFIDSLSIQQDYSVGDYERDALALLDQLFKQRDFVIMTGGSGLFINAVCFGLDNFPEVPETVKKEIEKGYATNGISWLQDELKKGDPEYYEAVDLQNPHRLMRALEVIKASGKAYSSFRKGGSSQRNFIPIFLQMHHPRTTLYERINLRVDLMMQAGQLEEVKSLFPFKTLNALQTVGYQEIIAYLDEKASLEEAVRMIKQNSRRYAKRQITWMRRDKFWKHIRPEDFSIALSTIENKIKNGIQLKVMHSTENEFESRICAFQQSEMIGFVPFSRKPKNIKCSPTVMLVENEEVKILLEHEATLIKEELGG